jgi:tetratricopeptide (TPR) repeat protein
VRDACRDMPNKARSLEREYNEQMVQVHCDLVASGLVTPGKKQKVDLALVAEFLRLRGGSPSEDGPALLAGLQDDLDDAGCADVTLDFLLRMDRRMMDLARRTAVAETIAEDSDALGQGVGHVLADRFQEAVSAFNQAAASGRHGPEVYWHRGRAFQLAGDSRHALLDYDRFLETGDTWRRPFAFGWRAEILAAERRAAEAVRSLEDAVACIADHYDRFLQTKPSDREVLENVLVELRAVVGIVERLGGTMPAGPDGCGSLGKVKARLAGLRVRMGA